MDSYSDYYEVLDVDRSASEESIRAAYRDRVKEVHPDRGGDQKAMQLVNEAREVLTHPKRRRRYDDLGHDNFVEQYGGTTLETSEGETSESDSEETEREDESSGEDTEEPASESKEQSQDRTYRRDRRSSNQTGDADSTANTGQQSSTSNAGTSDGTIQAGSNWYAHRQDYTRSTYTAPSGGTAFTWPKLEVMLLLKEFFLALGAVLGAAISFTIVLLVALALFIVLGILGLISDFFEWIFILVGVLETGVTFVDEWYFDVLVDGVLPALVTFVLAWMLQFFGVVEDEEKHLGNRLRVPDLVLVIPLLTTIGLTSMVMTGPSHAVWTVLPPLSITDSQLLIALGVSGWVLCDRAVRVACETPPVTRYRSLRVSIAHLLWAVPTTLLMIHIFWRIFDIIFGTGYDSPVPYPSLEFVVAGVVLISVGVTIATTAHRFIHWLYSKI